jgi:membrane fusion protein
VKNIEFDTEKEENTEKRKISKSKVIAATVIFAIILIYVIYYTVKLVQNPTNTFIVTNGKISQEENDIGYIVREETVIKGQNYKNGMAKIKNEGEKVAKGDSVFRYYSSGEENLKSKIAELDVEIQELMQNEKGNYPSDAKLLESQIEKELDSICQVNNAQKIQEYKKSINTYITRKAKLSSPSNTKLKELLNQREEYENKLNSDSENVNATESGIVSYRVDGLENVLTVDDFSKLNNSFLQELNLKTGQTVASSEEMGKIINNYECYIVFNSNTNEAKNSKVGDTLKIRLQNSDAVKATIENIIDEENGSKTIAIKITNDVEKLISYRKISFDIIWWDAEGFRIPNEAIKEKDGLAYVVRNRNGYYNKMLVKILKQNDEFCIVRQYKTEELLELGFTNAQIYDMRNIALYDEIVLNPTDEQILQ